MSLKPRAPLASLIVAAVGLACLHVPATSAHCEIPCGIYGDRMRIKLLEEHTRTLEKSMRKIKELSQAHTDGQETNQLIRWVRNKEDHANKIQTIVYQYFMNQRIKPVDEGDKGHQAYVDQLTLLHRMLVTAMKCKQTVEPAHIKELRGLIDKFSKLYFEE